MKPPFKFMMLLLDMLLVFPFWLATIALVAGENDAATFLALAVGTGVLSFAVNLLIPVRFIAWQRLLAVGIAVAPVLVLDQHLLYIVFTVFSSYRGLLFAVYPWKKLTPPMWQWASLVLYFVSAFLFHFHDTFRPYADLHFAAGAVTLVVVLFLRNAVYLQDVTPAGPEEYIPTRKPVLRINQLQMAGTALFILLIGLNERLRKAVGDAVIALLRRMIPEKNADFLLEPKPGKTDLPPPLETAEKTAPWWMRWVELGLRVAVLLLLVYLLLRLLEKLFPQMWRILKSWLLRPVHAVRAGYVDESYSLWNESFFNHKRWRDWLIRRQRTREPGWEDLADNRERARFLYRQWLGRQRRQGFEWKPSHTAAEVFRAAFRTKETQKTGAAPEDTVPLSRRVYEIARYDTETNIDDEQIERMKKELEE